MTHHTHHVDTRDTDGEPGDHGGTAGHHHTDGVHHGHHHGYDLSGQEAVEAGDPSSTTPTTRITVNAELLLLCACCLNCICAKVFPCQIR